MENERSVKVLIDNKEYHLLLTIKAVKEISKRYGNLDDVCGKIIQTKDIELSINETVWFITLLANQTILIHNLKNDSKQELLTEEKVELLTTAADLNELKRAVLTSLDKGVKRNITSEDDSKNSQVG